jgi:hypothetical protein
MDFTLGEVMVATLYDGNNYFTQGFQQPFIDQSILVAENLNDEINILYYPNPTKDDLTIILSNTINQEFKVELFNVLGQVVSTQTGNSDFSGTIKFSFDLQNYVIGNYYLRISNSNILVKNIKILKTNY